MSGNQAVKVTTLDGQTHEFVYLRVEEGQMVGDKTILAIDHIAGLETDTYNREYSKPPSQTETAVGAAVGGGFYLFYLMMMLAPVGL